MTAACARRTVLALWSLLLLTLIAWQLTQPGAAAAAGAALFTAGPLLLPLRGLARSDARSYRWASLTLIPALLWSLMELAANPAARWPATAVVLLCVAALAALVAALRAAPRS